MGTAPSTAAPFDLWMIAGDFAKMAQAARENGLLCVHRLELPSGKQVLLLGELHSELDYCVPPVEFVRALRNQKRGDCRVLAEHGREHVSAKTNPRFPHTRQILEEGLVPRNNPQVGTEVRPPWAMDQLWGDSPMRKDWPSAREKLDSCVDDIAARVAKTFQELEGKVDWEDVDPYQDIWGRLAEGTWRGRADPSNKREYCGKMCKWMSGLFDLNTIAHVFAAPEPKVAVYAGAAHCASIAEILTAYGATPHFKYVKEEAKRSLKRSRFRMPALE